MRKTRHVNLKGERMKKEKSYSITPKGLIHLETKDDVLTQAILDSLELYARRTKCNAVLLTKPGGEFIFVEGVK